jgi:O-antigen/teichoic acid export membrane protein
MRKPFDKDSGAFERHLSWIHLRVLGIVIGIFIPTAALVGTLARRLLPGQPSSVWTTLAVGNVGYLLLAIGLANALALFSLNRPWDAVKAITVGLAVNITVGYVLSHLFSPYFAVAGLVAGGFVLAVQSSVVVRQTIRSGAHAVSSPS